MGKIDKSIENRDKMIFITQKWQGEMKRLFFNSYLKNTISQAGTAQNMYL